MPNWRTTFGLPLLTLAAIAIHGYHPYAEDSEIYLPGVEKIIHPQLFPYHTEFFQTQGSLTLFAHLIATTVRWSHLPFDYVLFFWHVLSILLLLVASWELSGVLFDTSIARWGSVTLMTALLTLPVAGTALYIMDQYVNPRNLAAFAGLLAVANTLKEKLGRAALWLVFAMAVHPLMGWFALSFCGLWLFLEWFEGRSLRAGLSAALAIPALPNLFTPTSHAYHEAIRFHEFHYILNWEWYEWLGALAPIPILWWLSWLSQRSGRVRLARTCRALAIYNAVYLVAALIVSVPKQFESLARIQPLRCLHLLYMLLIVITGGLVAEYVLKNRAWRWVALFLPLAGGMFIAQRSLFPASAHIEWPWSSPRNEWAQAFLWIRDNTPNDADFAMDPLYIRLPGEDTVAFRALARRSSIADGYKDSGTVSMFPPLANLWWEQFQAQKGWKNFGAKDFDVLARRYGVNWVIVQSPGVSGLECPYKNNAVEVCRIGPGTCRMDSE